MTIGVIGCGFWSGYQVAAWREADPTLQFVFCDRQAQKAQALADRFGAAAVYTDADDLFRDARVDAVDIITNPGTHAALTLGASERGLPVICQKPLATDQATATDAVARCRERGVALYVHENFRWQRPIRHLKMLIDGGEVGRPFRAHLHFNSRFPVFDNQPELARLERFVLADLGVHLLDVCRYLFGEARRVYCVTQQVNATIRGEDVASILLRMQNGMICTVELSYATVTDLECFPQTLAEVEGEAGTIRLLPNFEYVITTRATTRRERIELPTYDWVNPLYAVAQSAMVPLHQQFLRGLRSGDVVETTGADNLRTLALTYAAYRSADTGRAIDTEPTQPKTRPGAH
ncbi:Gfo/Idh/MocA family protein [Neolewinella sp.]|uniref:Gfo/Idh/MocA family protein n=1 Tax=Neolewinella sp. TaxID=2993543 RepID=UPI003B5275B1